MNQKKYTQIAQIIDYLTSHAIDQPNLSAVAQSLGMSTSSAQRIFSDYVGLSPKQFLKYVSVERAKDILSDGASTLSTSTATGLSSAGRLHDLFVTVEGMTPGEYKTGGKGLPISYSFHETAFGEVIVASTPKGICHLTFISSRSDGKEQLRKSFPAAAFSEQELPLHEEAISTLSGDLTGHELKLHLRGTPFQIKVWQALLTIPFAGFATYGDVAQAIDHPKAHRAVGTAVGKNPISYIIPCHRVIQSTGIIGNYMWGPERKKMIIAWEAAQERHKKDE